MKTGSQESEVEVPVSTSTSEEECLNGAQSTADSQAEQAEPITHEPEVVEGNTQDDKNTESETTNELTQQANKLKDELQRERAEFINYRKRVVQEKSEMEGSIIAKMIETILPTLDAFEQLFSSFEKDEEKSLKTFVEGAELIQKQLTGAFTNYGVEAFNPVDQNFDPGSMEALHSQESDEVSTDVVNEVYQKGYKLDGRLVRAARVSVLKPKIK